MEFKKMKIDKPYYEDMSRISNSNIGWYLTKGPAFLRSMLDGKEEGLSTSYLEKGTMIHEYILQPEEFWKDYIVLDFEAPRVKQQKDFLEEYHRLMQIDPFMPQTEIKLAAYRKAYSNKKSDDKCEEEAEGLIQVYQDYLAYLSKKDNKKIISFADVTMLKRIKSNIESHKKANELLFNLPETFVENNEFHINWNVDKYKVKCKSLLDRVCFDHVNKKIILVDLKTTANLYDFKHSVELYDYYRQIAFYGLAIQWYMQEELNLNSEEYDFEAYIVAIDTASNRNEIKVFNMADNTILKDKIDLINKTLQNISYHIKTDNWDHVPEYYEGDGVESL